MTLSLLKKENEETLFIRAFEFLKKGALGESLKERLRVLEP